MINEHNNIFEYSNFEECGFGKFNLRYSENTNEILLELIDALKAMFSGKPVKFSYVLNYISLLEEGALQVPLVFNVDDMFVSVFFIYNRTDARKFNDAKSLTSQTKYSKPLYFSSIDISDITEKMSSTRTLKLSDLHFKSNALVVGEYAMWWADDSDHEFGNSETRNILINTYQVFRQYESVYTGYLMHQLGLIPELTRASLPEQEKALPVIGPEHKTLLITLSKEKGIRFLFPVKNTTKFYREQFLYAMNIDFLALKLSIQEQGIEKDNETGFDSFKWLTEELHKTSVFEKNGNRVKRFESNHVTFI